MNINVLKKLNLTDGEIKVYRALIHLKKSSTGKIIEKSNISSSKVYLILEKLIQKGFVSFIIENNVKQFFATNPKNITYYIEKQEKELNNIKKQSNELIEDINKQLGKYEEESAQIYKGYPGIRAAFQNLFDEFKKGEELLFFFVTPTERTKRVMLFFNNLNLIRSKKEIKYKAIGNTKLKEEAIKTFKAQKNYELKFTKLDLLSNITIGKTKVLILLWEENPIAFEITSKRLAEKYRNSFYKLWEKI